MPRLPDPGQPPCSEILTFGAAGPHTVQRGVEYTRHWVAGWGRPAGETTPVPWPEAAAAPADRLFLSFGDVAHPDYVEVRVYGGKTVPDGRPAPTEPLSVIECRLTEPRREKRIRRWAGGVGVDLAVAGGGTRRIVAWASWDVPLLHRRRLGLADDTDDLQAAWLFTLFTDCSALPGQR